MPGRVPLPLPWFDTSSPGFVPRWPPLLPARLAFRRPRVAAGVIGTWLACIATVAMAPPIGNYAPLTARLPTLLRTRSPLIPRLPILVWTRAPFIPRVPTFTPAQPGFGRGGRADCSSSDGLPHGALQSASIAPRLRKLGQCPHPSN